MLRPGIGKQQEDALERRRRQRRQQQPGVVGEDPDVGDGLAPQVVEQAGDAVDEDLGADEADLGMGGRLRREVLAGTEADLEPQRRRRGAEQALRIEPLAFRRQRHRQRRQQLVEQRSAARPQLAAVAPAVEGRRRRVGRPGQWKADLRLSTRSSRSQEKPPSASAGRPKWP